MSSPIKLLQDYTSSPSIYNHFPLFYPPPMTRKSLLSHDFPPNSAYSRKTSPYAISSESLHPFCSAVYTPPVPRHLFRRYFPRWVPFFRCNMTLFVFEILLLFSELSIFFCFPFEHQSFQSRVRVIFFLQMSTFFLTGWSFVTIWSLYEK